MTSTAIGYLPNLFISRSHVTSLLPGFWAPFLSSARVTQSATSFGYPHLSTIPNAFHVSLLNPLLLNRFFRKWTGRRPWAGSARRLLTYIILCDWQRSVCMLFTGKAVHHWAKLPTGLLSTEQARISMNKKVILNIFKQTIYISLLSCSWSITWWR